MSDWRIQPLAPLNTTRQKFAIASLQASENAGLYLGDNARLVIGAAIDVQHHAILVALPGCGHRRALAGQQRLIDPALRAFRIPNAPPIVIFLDDLDRQAGFEKEPGHGIIAPGSDAQIDAARASG